MYAERLPPHDIGAEESVVGSVLIDSEAMHTVTSFLKAGDFYSEKNRWCYDACLALNQRGEAINQVTLQNAMLMSGLQKRPVELPLDGDAYVAFLDDLIASAAQ